MTEKSSWYKKKRKREEEVEEESPEHGDSPRKRKRGGDLEAEMPGIFGGINAKKDQQQQQKDNENKPAVAVIVVPYTKGAELAKRIRQYEMAAKEQSGWYLKVVERAGDSLTDLLHRSNPWS